MLRLTELFFEQIRQQKQTPSARKRVFGKIVDYLTGGHFEYTGTLIPAQKLVVGKLPQGEPQDIPSLMVLKGGSASRRLIS